MPAHPTMRALLAAEQDTKRALKAEQQNIAQAAQRTYEVAKQKSSTLREQVKRLKGEASGIAQAEGEIATLVRSGDAKRSVYVELSRRIGELESEELVGTTRLVNSAERPTQPNFPRRMPVLAASLSLGLVLAFAACCADRLFK